MPDRRKCGQGAGGHRMGLCMVMGGSGAGKTEYIYRKIIELSMKEPDGRFFVVTPEQATMQAQKEIVRLHPNHGTMNIDVVSFERLAYRIFSELSIPQPEVLDDTGKNMILRKLAGEKKDELTMFSSHLNRPGFIGEIKSMLSELYQYGATPEDLKIQSAGDGVGQILSAKLSDMEVIFEAFREFTKEKYITLEELLDVLCQVAERSELLRDSVMVLDGYTGFTPIQYRLIGILLKICRDLFVTVSATMEPGLDLSAESDETDLFDMSRKMTGKLKKLAEENGIKIYRDLIFYKRPLVRFRNSPALDHLERTFFRYPYPRYRGGTKEILLVQAKNPEDEADFITNRIETLVKKNGYRYRDIALVCGDLPGYSREITKSFEENGIPLFLDENRDVSGNPLIRLIQSALDILQKGFDYESMFRYLRTGLVTDQTEKVDRMEIYVRAMGIRGFAKWDAVWDRTFDGGENLNLLEMNAFKEEIMAPLRLLREQCGGRGVPVKTVTDALAELLEMLGAEEQLEKLSEQFKTCGMDREAREYEEIFGLVTELFEKFKSLLGDECVARREYAEILSAGFSELSVGMIPAGADRVVCGDLKRTRLDKIKVLFFLGVSQGIVPADHSKGGLFTDNEREILKKNSMKLAPTAREEGFMERFYLYLMMTKPSDQLILSWPAVTAEGKEIRPSGMIGEMKKRFPDLVIHESGEEKCPDVSVTAAKKSVLSWLQEPEKMMDPAQEEPRVLYRFLSSEKETEAEMENLAKAVAYSYKKGEIGRTAARELYGTLLRGSVTRMEGYAACAYSHFLNHGLGLRAGKEYELDLSDMGNLFHQSLDTFFRNIRDHGKDFRTITDAERRTLVRKAVEEVSAKYRNTIMKSSARNAYLEKKVERITDRTVRALIYQIRKGDFEPEEFEVDVSTRIPLKDGEALNLRGRIDRMDVFKDEDKVYVKIMDYKSGSTSFDLALLYHGLQLQLVVYMDAALKMQENRHPGKQAVPAGIFYYHIDDPVIDREDGMTDEEIEAGILRRLRMNGLVNSSLDVIRHMDRDIEKESDVIPVALKDGYVQEVKSSVAGGKRFARLADFVNGQLKTMGGEILDGNVAVNPYKQGNRTACDYCPYHSVCGFDLKTDGYGFRRFRPMKAEEIWKEIDPEESDENETEEQESGNRKPEPGRRKDGEEKM